MVIWKSIKQNVVFRFSIDAEYRAMIEAEYRAMGAMAVELIWISRVRTHS